MSPEMLTETLRGNRRSGRSDDRPKLMIVSDTGGTCPSGFTATVAGLNLQIGGIVTRGEMELHESVMPAPV